MTEPGTPSDASDADRAEQEALLDPAEVTSTGEAGEGGGPSRPVGGIEADEADVLEQETDVPVDEDDVRS